VRFRPGRRLQSWNRNCIALGLAGSFIEPLESTTIHLIQRGITHLLQNFPQVVSQSAVTQYNDQLDSELQHVRDFVVMHYALSNRRDTPYWEYVANMTLPPSLQHRIDLFRETGNVFHGAGELFAENSWVQVMMGQGVTPRQHHPTADAMSEAELKRFLDDIRSRTLKNVEGLPTHMDYLRSYCPAPAPAR
jgi:tryptophan halogenase